MRFRNRSFEPPARATTILMPSAKLSVRPCFSTCSSVLNCLYRDIYDLQNEERRRSALRGCRPLTVVLMCQGRQVTERHVAESIAVGGLSRSLRQVEHDRLVLFDLAATVTQAHQRNVEDDPLVR